MKRLPIILLGLLLAGAGWAQTTKTTVAKTFYRASGIPAGGTLTINWPTFNASGGEFVPEGTITVKVPSTGIFSVALYPTTTATLAPGQTGSVYYTVTYSLYGYNAPKETWSVPPSAVALTPQDVTVNASALTSITTLSLAQLATGGFGKGAVIGNTGSAWTGLAAGSDGTVLTADSTAATGIRWTVVSGGTGGGAPTDATYITQIPEVGLSAEQALSDLATGLLKSTTGTGVLSIATASDLPTGIDAANIADGSVSNAEFQYVNGVSSAIQTQLDGKSATSHTHTGVYAPLSHTQTASTITDFQASVSANTDVMTALAAVHGHANKALLDTYTQTEANLALAVANYHSHSNKSTLDTYTQTEANLASAVSLKHAAALLGTKTLDEAAIGDAKVISYNLGADKLEYVAQSGVGGGAPTDAPYVVSTPVSGLSAEFALSTLSTGILKVTTTTGALSVAVGADLPTHASRHATGGGDALTAADIGAAASSHNHTASNVTDFQTTVSANTDVAANSAARHSHSNKATLDTYDQTNANITSAVSLKHAAALLGTKTLDETDIANGKVITYNSSSGNLEYETPSTSAALDILTVTRTSTTQLTIGANCSASTPCNVAFGGTVRSITASATATISSGSGTVYIYVVPDGTITVGYNSTPVVTCSGCTAASGVTAFPTTSAADYTWTATSGVWDVGGGADKRAFLSTKNVSASTGIVVTDSAGTASVAVNTSTVHTYTTGTSAPGATCTIGQRYLRISTNQAYDCTSTNTWTEVSGGSGSMTYPGAGIANSTGSAWGTSYTTSGSGTVVALATSAALATPTLTTPTVASYTVATLPAAGTAGRLAVVTDAASAGSCTSGGGSAVALCRDSGSAWVPVGDGGSGSLTTASTIGETRYYQAANYDGIAASSRTNWVTPNGYAPTATVAGTAPWRYAALVYSLTAINYAILQHLLPSEWASAESVTMNMHWLQNGGGASGNVLWRVNTACKASGEDIQTEPTWNANQNQTIAEPTQNLETITSWTLDTTGCAAGELMFVRIGRIGDDGTDTAAHASQLLGASIKHKRTLQ